MISSVKAPPSPDLLVEAAERFGTPVYVSFEETVRQRCRALIQSLDGLPSRALYALKANATPALLRVIADEGLGFDAVSPGELALLVALGVRPERILYTTTSPSDAELATAADSGALVNLDDIERVDAFGRRHRGAEVCLRFNTGVGAGHHRHVVTGGKDAKFGIPIGQVEEAREVASRHQLRVVGLHQHAGSGVRDPEDLWPAVEHLVAVADRFPDLRFVNVGGGLSIPYRPEEVPVDLGRLRTGVAERTLDALHAAGHPDAEVWVEPGRYLVAESGVLVTRVHTLKTTSDRTFAGTDSGFNQLLRPTLYDSYHALANLSNPEGPLRSYDVVGNVCESGDLFARQREVQELRRGDLLAILDTGAYGVSMASTYNLRPLPAEVMVRPDGRLDVVRARLTAAELAEAVLNAAITV